VKLYRVGILGYVAYLVFLGFAIVAGPRNIPAYVALCLSFACSVLWLVARRQLGDAFSVTPQARHLVTRGLYSKIRHPVYVFGTPAFLFIVLALTGWSALLVWVIVILIQVVRLRREERVLADTFGDEYTAYRTRTWF